MPAGRGGRKAPQDRVSCARLNTHTDSGQITDEDGALTRRLQQPAQETNPLSQ